MSKLTSVADRIRDTKKRLEDKADALNRQLDGTDKLEVEAFARASQFLDMQAAEVDEIDKTIRQLSNLPLDG